MTMPTLAVTVFAFQLFAACALHLNQQGKSSNAAQWPSWPHFPRSGMWPHFPRSGMWPWSHKSKSQKRDCGENECGLLAGSTENTIPVDCKHGVKWMQPTALFIPGRGAKDVIYCPVPKTGTSMMFDIMGNLSLSNGETRTKGYRSVGAMVHGKDEGDIAKLCAAHSLVIIRNPWDRIVSAYVDKVLTKDTTSYRMEFEEFMGKINKVNASLLNLHFRPASVQCNTVGPHRHVYDSVLKIEDHLTDHIHGIFTRYLSISGDEVTLAIDTASQHSSAGGRVAQLDKSIGSGVDRTTYYFRQSNPDIVKRVYHDDVQFGNYKPSF